MSTRTGITIPGSYFIIIMRNTRQKGGNNWFNSFSNMDIHRVADNISAQSAAQVLIFDAEIYIKAQHFAADPSGKFSFAAPQSDALSVNRATKPTTNFCCTPCQNNIFTKNTAPESPGDLRIGKLNPDVSSSKQAANPAVNRRFRHGTPDVNPPIAPPTRPLISLNFKPLSFLPSDNISNLADILESAL